MNPNLQHAAGFNYKILYPIHNFNTVIGFNWTSRDAFSTTNMSSAVPLLLAVISVMISISRIIFISIFITNDALFSATFNCPLRCKHMNGNQWCTRLIKFYTSFAVKFWTAYMVLRITN